MIKMSVMTLGFLKDTFKPFREDGDVEGLRKRYIRLFKDIKKAGIDAIDIASFEVACLGAEFTVDTIKDFGFQVASFIHTGNYADGSIPVEVNLAEAKNAMETALKLGTKNFMIVPQAHNGIENLEASEIRANISANVKAINDYAKNIGLQVILEDYPDPSLHLSSADELEGMLSEVSGAKLVYDSANMLAAGDDPVGYARHFKGRIAHVHIKDVEIMSEITDSGERTLAGKKIRTVFVGTGIVDIPAVVKTLLADGYDGLFSLEFGRMALKLRQKALIEAKKYVEEAAQ